MRKKEEDTELFRKSLLLKHTCTERLNTDNITIKINFTSVTSV